MRRERKLLPDGSGWYDVVHVDAAVLTPMPRLPIAPEAVCGAKAPGCSYLCGRTTGHKGAHKAATVPGPVLVWAD